MITKLEESKGPGTSWNTVSLQKAITRYFTVQEKSNCYAFHERAKNESTRSLHRSPAEVLTNNVNSSNVRTLLPYILCKENHYNNECDKYVNLSERKKKLSQQQRCIICLKVGHLSKSCPNSQKKLVAIVKRSHIIIDVYVKKKLH